MMSTRRFAEQGRARCDGGRAFLPAELLAVDSAEAVAALVGTVNERPVPGCPVLPGQMAFSGPAPLWSQFPAGSLKIVAMIGDGEHLAVEVRWRPGARPWSGLEHGRRAVDWGIRLVDLPSDEKEKGGA